MIESAADQLLQYIQDPHSISPDGLVQRLGVFSPEVRQQLFSVENDNRAHSEKAKELLPAACKSGDLETVVWLLFLGADPNTKGQQVILVIPCLFQ